MGKLRWLMWGQITRTKSFHIHLLSVTALQNDTISIHPGPFNTGCLVLCVTFLWLGMPLDKIITVVLA